MSPDTADVQRLRPLLFSIAYRMLASVGEAEDIVQEAFVRYLRALADGTDVQSPKAFLSAVTTRLSIDQLRSARVRRETYVGQWLPEPLLTDSTAIDPADTAQQADSVSMAFLLVLERLGPVERAVFVLHDVFDYGYEEIAAIVGKSQENCRQLAVRARRRVVEDRPRFEASRQRRDELAGRFLAAMLEGDLDALVATLASDVVVVGDSGGGSPSWPRPILGADKVSRLLVGLAEQARGLGIVVRPAEVNGQPGVLFRDPVGRLINVFSLDIADGAVQTVRSVINPEKLGHLGPLADLAALQRRRHTGRDGS